MNKYFVAFENAVNFGENAVLNLVAYQFVEAFLEVGEFDICIDLSDPVKIKISSPGDPNFHNCPHKDKKVDGSKRDSLSQSTALKDGFRDFNPLESHATTSRDLLAYLSTSRELEDYTKSGVDKRDFRASLHKILLTVPL